MGASLPPAATATTKGRLSTSRETKKKTPEIDEEKEEKMATNIFFIIVVFFFFLSLSLSLSDRIQESALTSGSRHGAGGSNRC